MSNLNFLVPESLDILYERSLEISKTRSSILTEELHIDPIHRPSIGYWPSNLALFGGDKRFFNVPDIVNGLVVPFYTDTMQLLHVGVISKQASGKFFVTFIGHSKLGFFNMLSAKHNYDNYKDKPVNTHPRLVVYELLIPALKQADVVSSHLVSQKNMDYLSFAACLSIYGTPNYIKKFKDIQNFDITIGESKLTPVEYTVKSFCFEDCQGLGNRFIIPKLVSFCKTLPIYEREAFARESYNILKINLLALYPWLFEQNTTESSLFDLWKNIIQSSFVLHIHKFTPQGLEVKIRHISNNEGHTLTLSPETLAQFLSIYLGDLIKHSISISGGLPYNYIFDPTTNFRLPREKVYNILISLIYQVVLDVIKKV